MKTPFRGFTAILLKELTVVFRDPTTLFFMFFPPLIQIVAFGFALDNDVKHMAMVVLNEDRTTESRQLVEKFVNTQTFRVVGEVQSVDELSAAIREGQAYVGLQIPPDFTRNLNAGRGAQVQALIDGSSSTIALQALQTSMGLGLRLLCLVPSVSSADGRYYIGKDAGGMYFQTDNDGGWQVPRQDQPIFKIGVTGTYTKGRDAAGTYIRLENNRKFYLDAGVASGPPASQTPNAPNKPAPLTGKETKVAVKGNQVLVRSPWAMAAGRCRCRSCSTRALRSRRSTATQSRNYN